VSSPVALSSGLAKGRSVLAGFTSGQKAVTGVAVLALVLGGFFFASWAGKPTYAPAFTNLAAEDASAITQKLTEDKQVYRLADGGRTVEVPQSDVYAVRINLSGAGLPAGNTGGYSLMDKQGLTSSDFQQHVTYQRALEGELQKTIEAIDGVQAAIVHLVIPAQDVFTDDARKPTASVLVKAMPQKPIKASQVQAVVHLVSSSVEGLSPDDVTVAGADGRVLNAAGEDAGLDDVHTTQVKAYEDATADAVQTLLTQAVGPGHAVVRVDADLSYDQKSTKTERFVAEKNTPPLTESSTSETYKGAGTPVGGVLGPDNAGVPTGANGSETDYVKSSETKQNAVGKVTEETKSAPGQVRRQSVAVLLDAKTAAKLDASEVEKLVVAAAGIVPSRGDKVQVSTMSFDTTAADEAKKALAAEEAAKHKGDIMSLAKTGFVVVVVLSVLIGLARRGRKENRTQLELPAGNVGQITVEDLRELAALSQHELEAKSQLALDPAESELVSIRSDIGQLIEEQPDEVARLLRGWLADRRS
jgi:flagellar M-ring protein FliF